MNLWQVDVVRIATAVVVLLIIDGVGIPMVVGGDAPLVNSFIVPSMLFAALLAVPWWPFHHTLEARTGLESAAIG